MSSGCFMVFLYLFHIQLGKGRGKGYALEIKIDHWLYFNTAVILKEDGDKANFLKNHL